MSYACPTALLGASTKSIRCASFANSSMSFSSSYLLFFKVFRSILDLLGGLIVSWQPPIRTNDCTSMLGINSFLMSSLVKNAYSWKVRVALITFSSSSI